MKRLLVLCFALLMAFAMSGGAVLARDREDDDHDRARNALRRSEVMPILRILSLVSEHLTGDVIAVNLDTKRGRLCYESKF